MREKIEGLLKNVIHPEKKTNIIDSGIVRDIACNENNIRIELFFNKKKDPFAKSIAKQITNVLKKELGDNINIDIEISVPETEPAIKENPSSTKNISKVIAISSAKGGVGKSTVTAALARTLSDMGYKVGILDSDIYGPSQAILFGVEDFIPMAEVIDNMELITPAQSHGVKIMSIAFFIKSSDALIWRGPMATSALKQLIHQTAWGELDYLLIDLPPGTGDVHLTVLSEIAVDGAIIVSTPQKLAVADVTRGISMFRAENIKIPVLGMIENMAWFSPADDTEKKYYIFGRSGAEELAAEQGVELLGKIPVIMDENTLISDNEKVSSSLNTTAHYYEHIVKIIVDKVD